MFKQINKKFKIIKIFQKFNYHMVTKNRQLTLVNKG